MQSRVPSITPSRVQSRAPSPEQSAPSDSPSPWGSLCDDDAEGSEDEPGGGDSEEEEDDMRQFLDEDAEQEPGAREEIRGWPELREQIKEDLKTAHKQKASPSSINQLMILRNFATLQIKGLGRMAASNEIARQWFDGKGVHFARQIRSLARHYQ